MSLPHPIRIRNVAWTKLQQKLCNVYMFLHCFFYILHLQFFPPRWVKLRYIWCSIDRKTNGQLLCFLFLFNYISMHNILKITKIYSKLIFIPKGTGYIIHDIGITTRDYVPYGTSHLNHLNSSAGNFSGRVVMISATFDPKENVAVIARCFDARSLQWRHNGGDGVSNHQRLDYLLKSLFRCRSKKTSKLRDTGLCEGNSPVTGEFPSQRAKIVENVSMFVYSFYCIKLCVCSSVR